MTILHLESIGCLLEEEIAQELEWVEFNILCMK